MTPTLAPSQLGLARHALGLPHRTGESYRNRYFAAPREQTYDQWQAMVAAGLAVRHPSVWKDGRPMYAGGAIHFSLTRAGAEAALLPGERLAPEDFPEAEKAA